jgi:hypothetical protein
MWDEVRSSIAEWVKEVPPGCPEDKDMSSESHVDGINLGREENV